MLKLGFPFLFFLLFIWSSASRANLYYFESIPADINNQPGDRVYHELLSREAGTYSYPSNSLMAHPNKVYRDLKNSYPPLTAEEQAWELEAAKIMENLKKTIPTHYYRGEELRPYFFPTMESPQTDSKTRSLYEHIYLSKARGTEFADNFNIVTLKRFLIKSQFFKALLQVSDKSDEEKIQVLDTIVTNLNKYFDVDSKSASFRYVRLADKDDLKSVETKLLNGGAYTLEEELRENAGKIETPAGLLGDEYLIQELQAKFKYAEHHAEDFKFTVNLFELNPAEAQKVSDEMNKKAQESIDGYYKREIERQEKERAAGRHVFQDHVDRVEQMKRDAETKSREYIQNQLESASIDSLFEKESKAREILLKSDRKAKLEFLEKANAVFTGLWTRIRNMGEELTKSDSFNFKKESDRRFFELLLKTYYSDMSYTESKDVIKGLIDSRGNYDPVATFRMMVLHSGPQLQKLLQILGRKKELSYELKSVFNQVEDSGLETPWRYVEPRLVNQLEGQPLHEINKNPFVGTIAQTYRGRAGEDIAIRIAKNGIASRLAAEEPRLVKVCSVLDGDRILRANDFPLLTPIRNDIKEMAKDELDFIRTAKHQIIAKGVYTVKLEGKKKLHTIEIAVPKTYSESNAEVLYSSWQNGESFEKYGWSRKEESVEIAETLATYWMKKALFEGQLFHADLHQGNLNIKIVSPDHVVVNLLDFGISDTLPPQEREILLRLSVAAKYVRNPKLLADYIWALSVQGENKISKEALASLVIERRLKSSAGTREWLYCNRQAGGLTVSNFQIMGRKPGDLTFSFTKL